MPRNIQFKVGLFIIITSLMIVAFIGYVAYKKGVFAKEQTYTLVSKSGENLTEGMPVVFSGFRIGRVDSLELNEDGRVVIKIKVPEQHVRWIRTDSVFILEKPLIGPARINIATANLSAPALPPDAVPQIVEADDINEAVKSIKPILEKINSITHHVETLTSNLADPGSDMAKMLSHAKSATERVDGILKKIDGMAAKTDEQLYGSQGALMHVQTILADLILKLKKMDPVLDNINRISADTADTTKDMKALRQDIDGMVHDIDSLLKDIDRLIPLKKETQVKLP
jgi:phospholipid/cholesterol/gamma-HCH transport system substrate-binding protein